MKWIALLTVALFLYSCGKEEVKETVNETTNKVELPSGLFAKEKIDGAVPVLEARKLKAGDKVKVQGKVMGNRFPFIDSRAAFIIGDPEKLVSCDLKPEDQCEEPWDVCCEDNEDIAAGTLNVQIVDSSGKVLKTGIEGQNGLNKLSTVIIEGVVAENTTDKSMTINAEKIFVQK